MNILLLCLLVLCCALTGICTSNVHPSVLCYSTALSRVVLIQVTLLGLTYVDPGNSAVVAHLSNYLVEFTLICHLIRISLNTKMSDGFRV